MCECVAFISTSIKSNSQLLCPGSIRKSYFNVGQVPPISTRGNRYVPHPCSNQGVHFLAYVITENGLKLFSSNEPLKMRPGLFTVANLTEGSSVFDVGQVRHCITNCDRSQGRRGEASNIGFYLYN